MNQEQQQTTHVSHSGMETHTIPMVDTPVTQVQTVVKQPRRSSGLFRIFVIFMLIIISCSLCGIFVAMLGNGDTSASNKALTFHYVYGDENSSNKIASIVIDAPITIDEDSSSGGLLSSAKFVGGYKLKEDFRKLAEDDSIKAVVVEVNSPGGAIIGMKAVADGIKYYKDKTNKPVYTYVNNLSASAAYYISASTDKIIAEDASIVGSIGAIFGPFVYYDGVISDGNVLSRNGIEYSYITAGTYKDFGSEFRRMTKEEKDVVQQAIDQDYDDFVAFVSVRRGIPQKVIKNDIKALIYGGQQAKKIGLIDEIGTRQDAYDAVAKAAKLSTYQIVRPTQSAGLLSYLVGSKLLQPASSETYKTKCVLCGQRLSIYGDPMQYLVVKE